MTMMMLMKERKKDFSMKKCNGYINDDGGGGDINDKEKGEHDFMIKLVRMTFFCCFFFF